MQIFFCSEGKGAQIMHLVHILATIWRQHMRYDKRDGQHVEKVLDHLVHFYQCLATTDRHDLHPFHLPKPIANQILKHVDEFLMHYCLRAEHSLDQAQHKFRWSIVPKHNYFWHLGKQATDLNPRMSWCYANVHLLAKS